TLRSIDFQNFSMNHFGVVSPHLQKLARTPDFPIPFYQHTADERSISFHWQGAYFKEVEGRGEQSALGLPRPEGVYVFKIDPEAKAYQNGLRKNDVILQIGEEKIKDLKDFQKEVQTHFPCKIKIYRLQQKKWIFY